VLKTATEDSAAADCALHDICRFVASIVRPRSGRHDTWLVSHKNDLATAWVHVAIHDASKPGGHEASAIYHDVGTARRVEACSF
jgi:hypothetical protein